MSGGHHSSRHYLKSVACARSLPAIAMAKCVYNVIQSGILVTKGKIVIDQVRLTISYDLGIRVCCLFSHDGLTSLFSGVRKWTALLGLDSECYFFSDGCWTLFACSRVDTITVQALLRLLVGAFVQSVVDARAQWAHVLSRPAGTCSMAKALALESSSEGREI